jgi:hypothetical protein
MVQQLLRLAQCQTHLFHCSITMVSQLLLTLAALCVILLRLCQLLHLLQIPHCTDYMLLHLLPCRL